MALMEQAQLIPDKQSFASYTSAGFTAIFGALTLQEWGIIVGIAATVGTFWVNFHYKRKDSALQREADKAKREYFEQQKRKDDI